MKAKLREQLNTIQTWLDDPDEGEALADVLSALRGPDDPRSERKEETTIHIRRRAFPLLGCALRGLDVTIRSKKPERLEPDVLNVTSSSTEKRP